MHQSLTDHAAYDEYRTSHKKRPVFIKRPQLYFIIVLVAIDLGSTWLAYYFAHGLLQRSLPDNELGPFWEFLPLPLLQSLLLVVIFFVQRMYQRRRPSSHIDEFYKIIVFSGFAMLLTVAFLALALPDFQYHRTLLAYALALHVGILSVARIIHAEVQWGAQARGIGDERVLVIGTGEIGQMVLQKVRQNPQLGYQVVGVVSESHSSKSAEVEDTPVLGTLVDIPRIIEEQLVDEVIIGLPESNHQELVHIISLCEREKVGIRVFPDVFQIMASEVSIGDLGGLPLLTVRDVALQGWKLTLKRGMDVIVSAALLVIASPLMLFTALLIKLDSPGPVFYTQERMGLDARPFKILKFRSMRTDAEEAGPGWTVPDDPRKTKLGNVLRRFELDELPQFINVLLGDMSLVGPRPERPVYVEQFRQSIPRYMDRHRERAGLTGWAQVNGLRGDTSIAERTKYDLWYIENWSLGLDIKILIRTAFQMLLGLNRNAY